MTQVGLGVYIKGYGKFDKLVNGGSNNEAEFMALIWGMEMAINLGFKYVKFFMDSKIVENRACGHRPKGKWENPRMNKFQDKVLLLKTKFETCYFNWIPRENNYVADELSKKAINNFLRAG